MDHRDAVVAGEVRDRVLGLERMHAQEDGVALVVPDEGFCVREGVPIELEVDANAMIVQTTDRDLAVDVDVGRAGHQWIRAGGVDLYTNSVSLVRGQARVDAGQPDAERGLEASGGHALGRVAEPTGADVLLETGAALVEDPDELMREDAPRSVENPRPSP